MLRWNLHAGDDDVVGFGTPRDARAEHYDFVLGQLLDGLRRTSAEAARDGTQAQA